MPHAVQKFTLCYVRRNDEVLLGMKKRGFGKGLWNGLGGKLKKREAIKTAVHREVYEEAKIRVGPIKKCGMLNFFFAELPDTTYEVHIFSTRFFLGKPKETEEMRPRWFREDKLPFRTMWPDDKYWMSYLLQDKKFKGKFFFDKKNRIIRHAVKSA